MTRRQDNAVDAVEYAFGAPLFSIVCIVAGAVMAVGIVPALVIDRLRH
jgi:hypothetical protein